jgi:transposase
MMKSASLPPPRPDRCPVGPAGPSDSPAQTPHGRPWPPVARSSRGSQRNPVHLTDRCGLGGSAGAVSVLPDLSSALPAVGPLRCYARRPGGARRRPSSPRRLRSPGGLHRRDVRTRKKGGAGVGKTKRGKGTKIMAVADGAGLPVAVCAESATPHEVTLVQQTLAESVVAEPLQRLIGDKAYDSDRLDRALAQTGVEMIAPHNRNRKHPTQDGRSLCRYRRRWKVERLFAWLQHFRRLVVRWEHSLENFLGMVHLGCAIILLRHL